MECQPSWCCKNAEKVLTGTVIDAKYDSDASRFQIYEGKHPKSGKPYKIDVGYERFLGPELFFNPEIYGTQNVTALPQLIDECIQNCPCN